MNKRYFSSLILNDRIECDMVFDIVQWRSEEHPPPTQKLGFGPPSWILQRVVTWRQSGFGPLRTVPLSVMRGSTATWETTQIMNAWNETIYKRLLSAGITSRKSSKMFAGSDHKSRETVCEDPLGSHPGHQD
ncbi:hypothetical protein TNCV_2974551 [Trichonephila clavipes]|nr:hypothetical protein TNCV_2974551 [Trichonephila clavipes]